MSLSIEHHGFTVTAVDSNWFTVESEGSDICQTMNSYQLEEFAEKLNAIRLAAKHVGVDKNGRNINI